MIALDEDTRRLLRARLVEVARSTDAVRLAGAYQLRVTQYKAYRRVAPLTGESVDPPVTFRVEGTAEPALLALVNDRPVPPVTAGDDPRLDALGNQIFNAFLTHDRVSISGLGELSVHTIEGRDGLTVDGDPIRIPARRTIWFQPDDSLDELPW